MQSLENATPKKGAERARQVRTIFSEIAPRYDLLNHVLSLNIDRSWRKKAVARLRWDEAPDGRYLDACAGTFDLALELTGNQGFAGRVVGSDFAHPMLVQGAPKIRGAPVSPVCGDSMCTPFPDHVFDGATVGFGIRNLSDLRSGLGELRRIIRPGKRLVILEFTVPPNVFVRGCYSIYFHYVLPLVGRIVSGHPWAYTYLPESVKEFPGPEELARLLQEVGFTEVGWKLLTGGIAAIHWGEA